MPPKFEIPALTQLAGKRIVLASSSPRRREILAKLGLTFEVEASFFDEASLDKLAFETPGDYVCENAYRKANEVFEQLSVCFRWRALLTGWTPSL